MHGPCRPVTTTAATLLLICTSLALAVPRAADFLPTDDDGLLTKLIAPHSVEEFMSEFYEKATFRAARNDAEYFAWLRAETLDKLDEVVDIFKRDNSLSKGIQLKVNGETRNVPTNLTGGYLRRIMQEGSGVLVRFEDLKRVKVPAMEMLAAQYRAALGFDTTVHLYMGLKEGTRALAPHTDPYDVMVLQLYGSKEWTTCVPKPTKMIPEGVDMHEAYSDADLCQLQEIEIKRQKGCTSYSDADLSRMSCEHFTLKAGDTLYMPKGVIHFARTGAEGSAHLTMSLERDGANWVDVLAVAAAEYSGPEAEEFIQALTELTGMTEGLPLLQAFPMWAVPRAPISGRQTPQATRCRLRSEGKVDADCWAKLREMFRARVALVQDHLASRHEKSRPSATVPWRSREHPVQLASAVNDDAALDHVLAKLGAGEKLATYNQVLTQETRPVRQRRATNYGSRTCTSGCDDTCRFTSGCTGSCDGTPSCGCTQSCDGNCNTGCNSGCDTRICNSNCDGSCDHRSGCTLNCNSGTSNCNEGCNIFSSCDTNCNGNCRWTNCNRNCISGCTSSCDTGCNIRCTDCDSDCNTGRVCDSSCDDSCQCNHGYAGDASQNACRYCSGGFYAPQAGLTSCIRCSTCSSGSYNYGCGGTSGGSCRLCGSCGAGFFRSSCSGYSGGSCAACPSNTYSNMTDAALACKSCQPCSSGYQRIGCGGASDGYCRGVLCSGEGSLSAGSVSKSNGGRYPSTATYRCNAGYTVSGLSQRSCSTGGAYQGSVPTCVGVVCASLSSFNGVTSTTNNGRYPSTATFSCPAGYQLLGSSSLTCGTTGQWSSAIPKCEPILCAALGAPANGAVSYDNNERLYPSTATYSCNLGYILSSTDTRTCTPSGDWTGIEPACLSTICDDLSGPINGSVSVTNGGTFPSQASYSCIAGYSIVGSTTRDCSPTGSWLGSAPTCQGVLCAALSDPANGNVSTTNGNRYPSQATFSCQEGYELSGDPILDCMASGTWDSSSPRCQACEVNEYKAETNYSTRCQSCPAQSSTGGKSAQPSCLCLAGYGGDASTGSACTVCTQGKFKKELSNAPCQDCAPGYTTDGEGWSQDCIGTVCRTHEYESAAATSTTNRVCSDVSNCVAGEEEVAAPTPSTDRICVSCAAGTFNPLGQGSCAVHTTCASGEGEITAPTASSDRICDACTLGGTFVPTINGPCQPVTPCPALQEELTSPTLTTDRVCRPCNLGTTYFDSGSAACVNATICPPGAREQPPATLSTDRACVANALSCDSGLTPADNSCICPDNNACTSCMLQSGFGATLLLLDELPLSAQVLDTCARPASSGQALYDACLAICDDKPDCMAFNVQAAAGECCLYSAFSTLGVFSAPGAALYTMPQCDNCATGYYKSGRRCLPFAIPPNVNSGLSTRIIQIPLATPANTTLLSIAAEAEAGFGPITFRVDNPLLRITTDGNLELVAALDSATTFSATVTVRDNRTSCTVRGATGQPTTTVGPCTVAIPVTVRVAVFLSCPTSVNAFVGLDKATAEVTWDEPRLPAFLGDLIVSRDLGSTDSSRAPFLYPVGRHRVTYTSEPLSLGGSITCTFDVVVRPGYSVTVPSIARRASPRRVQEFFVVELGEANEGVRLAAIEGELQVGGTLSIGVVSPAGVPFAVTAVMGHEVHLIVDLEWCREGASFDASELLSGTLAVDIITVSGSSSPPAFTDLGSGMTADGGCIRMRGQSATTSRAILFRELTVSLTLDDEGDRRRRRDLRANNSTVYLPARQYQIAVVTEAADGGDLISLAGSTALEDTQPPVFLNCPVTPITVTATPGALTAAATWEELAAVDNIATSPVVTGTHSPGATFSILASPHTVTYTASDGALTSTCSFEVIVTYDAVTVTAANNINSTFPATLQQAPLRYTTTVRQALMGNGLGVVETLTSLDTADFTELRIELAAPAGQPIALRTRPEAIKSQLVVQLAWGRAGRNVNGPAPVAQADVGVRLEFEGLVLEESEQTDQLTAGDVAQSLQPTNTFRAARAAVDPSSGYIGVLEAYTLPFRRGMSFDKLTLVFQVPAGRNSSGPAADWTLLPGSGLWAEYGYAYEAAPDLSALSGFVALLDTEPPVFTSCPVGVVTAPTPAGLDYALPSWPMPQVVDNSGTFELRATHAPGGRFNLSLPSDAPERVEYVATDAFDNTAKCSFSVRVVDEEPPVLAMPPAFEVRLPAAPRSQVAPVPVASIMPTAMSDNSGFPVVLQSPTVDAVLGVGTHVLTARAADAWGNVATETVTVTVVDDTPPIITCPPDLTVPPPLQLDAAVPVEWASPTIDDNDWDGTSNSNKLKLALSKPPGSTFTIGTEEIVATVTDASQNAASCSFNVTVAAPTITQTSTAASDNSASLYGGAGAGIASLVIIVVAVVLVRRARRKLPQNWDEIFAAMEQFKDKTGTDGPNIPREIVRGHMTLLEELGKGAFGVVWKGLLKEEPKRPGYLVAAKSLHETCTATDKQELLEEAAIMAQFDSPFVVQLVGLVTLGSPVLMVIEFAEHGSLKFFLEKRDTDERLRLLWAGDIAEGMAHVHSKGFLHRDLATRNVLVGSDMRCKVSDFGLAREVDEDDAYYRSRGGQLPVRWTAPEALEERKFSEKTDAWSFGVTLYEIWTKAALPYGEMNNQKVWVEVAHGLRLSQPETCSAEVYAIMRSCWAEVQGHRPSMHQMTELLRRLYESYTGECAPVSQGHESEYETPVSSRHRSDYSDAQPARHHLPGVYGSVDSEGRESSQEHTEPLAERGSIIGVQMQNPIFNASSRMANENRGIFFLNGGRTMQCATSTDDENAAVYDIGNVVDTGSHSVVSSSRHDMEGSEKNISCGGSNTVNAIYDLDSTTSVSVDRLQTKSPGIASNLGARPTVNARVLNLAWEEESEHLTGASVLPKVNDDVYGNAGDELDRGATRQTVTASDVGRRVLVQGYSCSGVLRFVGPHHERGTLRCGVELEEAMGKNDGTVGDHVYFKCSPGHGVLAVPSKISLLSSE